MFNAAFRVAIAHLVIQEVCSERASGSISEGRRTEHEERSVCLIRPMIFERGKLVMPTKCFRQKRRELLLRYAPTFTRFPLPQELKTTPPYCHFVNIEHTRMENCTFQTCEPATYLKKYTCLEVDHYPNLDLDADRVQGTWKRSVGHHQQELVPYRLQKTIGSRSYNHCKMRRDASCTFTSNIFLRVLSPAAYLFRADGANYSTA